MPALPLLTLLAFAAAAPPLAGAPQPAAEQAAAPLRWDDVPALSGRRLRLSGGTSLLHTQLHSPGGNALGFGLSAALELGRHELSMSLYGHGGMASQDTNGRNTGPATSYLRTMYRVAPFAASTRVMLEAGGQLGYDRAWAWCSSEGDGACGYVPGRLSWAAVAGSVVQLRAGRASLAIGLDLLLRGPRAPAPVDAGPLALQAWVEAGFGGLPW